MKSAVGRKPGGFNAIGIFLFFGAVVAGLAAITLLWRGTPLDRLWVLNQMAYKRLVPMGRAVGILFLLLSGALTTAGIGWFRRRPWGWKLAVVIIATQVVGISLTVLEATRCEVERVSLSPVHYCCFSGGQRSETALSRISSEAVQKRHSQ